MLMLTTPLPHHLKMIRAYPLIWTVSPVEISNKGLVRGLLSRGENQYQEAFDALGALVPEGANAVVGIQVSTATQDFANGTFLYVTLIGTPVEYVDESGEVHA